MTDLTFAWSGIVPSDILGRAFTKISVVQAVNANPLEVILWMGSDGGLHIRSHMHDIAEREEVGVLEFSRAGQPDWSSYLETVELPQEFREKVRVEKLVLESDGMRIECGLALEGNRGGRVTLLPSDSPVALAIEGTDLQFRSEPEYPLGQYEKVPFC